MSTLVVHLARAANGIEPFERFLASYERHPARASHELLVVFKGFESNDQLRPFIERGEGIVAHADRVDDSGFDLNVYFGAAGRHDADHYCFLNSFSAIAADGWLATMLAAAGEPQVGLVGATGSWASVRSYVRFDWGLGGPYGRAIPDRALAKRLFRASTDARDGWHDGRAPSQRARLSRHVRTARSWVNQLVHFESFPAAHVRTNAFLISRDALSTVGYGSIKDKQRAYRLESGRTSITNQVRGAGLRAVLAGRDGDVFDVEQWNRSATFWQADQENLLITDNQTEDYARGSTEWRTLLERFAWGAPASNPFDTE